MFISDYSDYSNSAHSSVEPKSVNKVCVWEKDRERREWMCLYLRFLVMRSLLSLLVFCQNWHRCRHHIHTHTHTRCTAVNRRSLTLSDVAFSPGRKHAHLFTFPTTPTATVLLQDHRNTHKHIHTEIPHNKSHFIGRETQQNTHTHF